MVSYMISIHALLAESDGCFGPAGIYSLISIHALLAESDIADRYEMGIIRQISIHALLAESDFLNSCRSFLISYFYPRSPCGERRASFAQNYDYC